MPHEVVTALSRYGEDAGSKLIGRFIDGLDNGVETEMTWDNHRWIRYRSTMAVLESFLKDFSFSLEHAEPEDRSISDFISRDENDPPKG